MAMGAEKVDSNRLPPDWPRQTPAKRAEEVEVITDDAGVRIELRPQWKLDNLKVAAAGRYFTTNVGKKELPGQMGVACEMLKAVIKEVDDQDDEE